MNKNSNWISAYDALPADLRKIASLKAQQRRSFEVPAVTGSNDFLASVESLNALLVELGGGHLGCGGLHLGARRLIDARQGWATGDIAGAADWRDAHGLGVIAVVVNAGGLAAVVTGQGVGLGDIATTLGFCDNGNGLLCLFGLDVSARKTKLGRGSTGPVALCAAANADVFHGSSLLFFFWLRKAGQRGVNTVCEPWWQHLGPLANRLGGDADCIGGCGCGPAEQFKGLCFEHASLKHAFF